MSRPAHVLPRQIDLRKFAQQRLSLSGEVPLNELGRLSALSLAGSAPVVVHIDCSIDDQRRRLLQGTADCLMQVPCQRCLDRVEVALHADIHLAIVWSEDDSSNLPKSLDPLVLGEGTTDFYAIIEDELLLSMPMVSYHEEDCIEQTSFGEDAVDTSAESEVNPFQVLKQLKGSPKS